MIRDAMHAYAWRLRFSAIVANSRSHSMSGGSLLVYRRIIQHANSVHELFFAFWEGVRLDYCQRYTRMLFAKDADGKRLLIVRARCKMWSCEYCAQVNRAQWLKKLISGIEQIDSHEWGFWTLTHALEDATYVEQREHLSSAWNRLRNHLSRHQQKRGHALYYVRVIEIGSRSTQRMHMHALVNLVPTDIEIRNQGKQSEYHYSPAWGKRIIRAQFGGILDIRDVSGTNAYQEPEIPMGSDLETTRAVLVSSYISKYMTKESEDKTGRYPKKTRRYNTSRNWPQPTDSDEYESDLTWDSAEKLTEKMASNAWRHGLRVFDLQRNAKVDGAEFDENGDYIY